MIACDICGKRAMSGHNVSHSHRKTKRRFLPNLHKKKLTVAGQTATLKVCAQCLKTMGKLPRERKPAPEKAAS